MHLDGDRQPTKEKMEAFIDECWEQFLYPPITSETWEEQTIYPKAERRSPLHDIQVELMGLSRAGKSSVINYLSTELPLRVPTLDFAISHEFGGHRDRYQAARDGFTAGGDYQA